MHGISVLGHEVTLSGLAIDGAPLTDLRIGAGTKGSGGMSGRVELTDSSLSGGQRDVVSIFGAVGLRIADNLLSGARAAGPPACIFGRPIVASRHSTSTLPGTRSSATRAPGSSWTLRRRTDYPSSHRESSSSATSSSSMRGRPRRTAAPAS
jgi:hypothetical protein